MLSTFFVCLTFSTGIPILYPIAAVNFFLFYFSEKYFFIHMYRIPPHFATLVGRRVAGLIPLGILIHLAMSVWVLSNNDLFSSNSGNQSTSSGLVQSSVFGTTIKDKITGYATFPLFMCFCAVIGLHLLYYYYKYSKKTIDRVYDFFFGFCSAKYREQMIARRKKTPLQNITFTRAVQRNLIKGLASYNILQNPTYKEAFGITWKFAVENKGVRDVRKMKAKAQATEDEDDAAKVEELTRNAVGLPRNLRSQPAKAGKKMAGGLDRNRSFFGAFSDGKETTKQQPAERPSSGNGSHPNHPQAVGMQLPPPQYGGRGPTPPAQGHNGYGNGQPNGGRGYPQQAYGPPPGSYPHGQPQPHNGKGRQGYAHPVPHGHPQQQYGGYGPAQQAQHRNQYQMVPQNGNPNQRRL